MNFNDPEEIAYWKKWLSRITPCTIGATISIFIVIYSLFLLDSSGGWSLLAVIFLTPLAVGYLTCHWIIINIFKEQVKIIWLLELLVIVVSYLIFTSLS